MKNQVQFKLDGNCVTIYVGDQLVTRFTLTDGELEIWKACWSIE